MVHDSRDRRAGNATDSATSAPRSSLPKSPGGRPLSNGKPNANGQPNGGSGKLNGHVNGNGKANGFPAPRDTALPLDAAELTEVEFLDADDVLVKLAQSGDEQAFERLIERHQRAIYGYFRARVLVPTDAEDLCQEVFLRCYRMPASFASPAMVRPWLMGIARNVLREHVRRLSRRKEVAWTSLCLDVDDSTQAVDDSYDDVVDILPGCLESLGGSAREALDMYYRSKFRLAQIGERLRRSEGAVKLLMYRARQALKNCLTRKAGCPIKE